MENEKNKKTKQKPTNLEEQNQFWGKKKKKTAGGGLSLSNSETYVKLW